METATKTRREVEEESRRAHILNVSEQLFAEKGIHETSMADIARDAEFGVGTIYKYFQDKKNLVESLLKDRLIAHFTQIDAALQSKGTPTQIINRVVDVYLMNVMRNAQFFKMYFTHFHPGMGPSKREFSGEFRLDFVQQHKRNMLRGLERVFNEGRKKGEFVDVESTYLATALFGLLISFAFLAEHEITDEDEVKALNVALKRIFFDKILNAPIKLFTPSGETR